MSTLVLNFVREQRTCQTHFVKHTGRGLFCAPRCCWHSESYGLIKDSTNRYTRSILLRVEDRKPRTAAQASYYSRTEIDILSVFRDNVGCPRKSRTVPPVITRRLPIAPAFIQRNRCVGIRGFPQIASRAATYRPNAFAFIFIVNKSHRDFYCHVDIRAIQKPLNLKAKSKRLKETTSSVADPRIMFAMYDIAVTATQTQQ